MAGLIGEYELVRGECEERVVGGRRRIGDKRKWRMNGTEEEKSITLERLGV